MPENPSPERAVDDWSTAKLDRDAYLRRVGYSGPLDPNEATLTALYRAHLAAIRSIVGRTYTVTRPGHVKERRTLTDDEFASALTTEFAQDLSPAEIATLVAAPTAR